MMTLNVNGKELKITFGYEATLKSRLLSRMAKIQASMSGDKADFEKIEDLLLFIPEIILVGLQKEHSSEYGYNLDTRDGYDAKKEEVFGLVAEYLDSGEVNPMELFNQLQDEITNNGFFKKMFEEEMEKAEKAASNKKNQKAEN